MAAGKNGEKNNRAKGRRARTVGLAAWRLFIGCTGRLDTRLVQCAVCTGLPHQADLLTGSLLG
jgi:hypothetical protein